MAQRSSRKRRKQQRRSGKPAPGGRPADAQEVKAEGTDTMARGYARGRARDEAARAALKPLAAGERPGAVTVGALVAAALALAELVSFGFGYSPGEDERILRSVVAVGLLGTMAWGMWRIRYWAVLGMQTLLGITIVLASAAAMFAANLKAVVLVLAIVLPAGTLFWFLVKSMARIQMPERPIT
ncbi:MAG: hypothetical protein H0U24_07725 [Thermoleophilaceae bacterium]|nr:hypothetical protein [Thermoleophilaceae bacterium]